MRSRRAHTHRTPPRAVPRRFHTSMRRCVASGKTKRSREEARAAGAPVAAALPADPSKETALTTSIAPLASRTGGAQKESGGADK